MRKEVDLLETELIISIDVRKRDYKKVEIFTVMEPLNLKEWLEEEEEKLLELKLNLNKKIKGIHCTNNLKRSA